MPREEYQRELAALHDSVLDMGEAVVARVEKAFAALARRDADRARSLIRTDSDVNELSLDLERTCLDLIALQQPVAGDLRFVVSSFKIVTDLERIADLATNLCRYVIAREREVFPTVDLRALGSLAVSMLDDALAAYARRDADACREIAARDDDLDVECERVGAVVVRDLVGLDAAYDESLFAEVSHFLLTVRDIERVGDHAVNIAARTLYMIENDDELIY
ncbi:phosphate signaling complex protein PhoU [Halegenticoccus tardaugens]|uniref:phosphate signaling complex protein PhoU n=1 Tax=Halegenticoccus tardaugens TaxID=2071624 RepID=UPI00100BDBD9|nr:phosphate signaling complex protein PhoU [Halegenticoccus tardaugens]